MKPLEEIITLDYGSGGKKTSSLIEEMLVPAFANEALSALGDGAILPGQGDLVFSTDSYVISPYFFPGGDIGRYVGNERPCSPRRYEPIWFQSL